MKRRIEHETLTLLREIRDLVQLLVLRQNSTTESLEQLAEASSRFSCSWSAIHGPSRKKT